MLHVGTSLVWIEKYMVDFCLAAAKDFPFNICRSFAACSFFKETVSICIKVYLVSVYFYVIINLQLQHENRIFEAEHLLIVRSIVTCHTMHSNNT